MKAIIYLPTLLVNTLSLLLPRWLFVATYKPASESLRDAEQQVRNVGRLAVYHAKRNLL